MKGGLVNNSVRHEFMSIAIQGWRHGKPQNRAKDAGREKAAALLPHLQDGQRPQM
jgi:hypothetical protein